MSSIKSSTIPLTCLLKKIIDKNWADFLNNQFALFVFHD